MTNVHENWLPIPKYEGFYEISDLGRVKSLPNKPNKQERILNPFDDGYGYLRVDLWNNKKSKKIRVHKLVMNTFLGESNLKIDHINGNKKDNRLENLRYCTQRENVVFYTEQKVKTSKYTNVTLHVKSGKWLACLRVNGKTKYLGLHFSEEEASDVVVKFKKENNII